MSRAGGQKRRRGTVAVPGNRGGVGNVVIPAFLTKTFDILSTDDYRDLISWNDAGDAIVVHRVEEFSENVLPRFFKHSNFASFVRQLNMYDFHKERQENPEIRVFRHPMFLRERRDLLTYIKRKTAGGPARTTYTRARDARTKTRKRRSTSSSRASRDDDDDEDDDDDDEGVADDDGGAGDANGSLRAGTRSAAAATAVRASSRLHQASDAPAGRVATAVFAAPARGGPRVVVDKAPPSALAASAMRHSRQADPAVAGAAFAGGAETAEAEAFAYTNADADAEAAAAWMRPSAAGREVRHPQHRGALVRSVGGGALAEHGAAAEDALAHSRRESTNWAAVVSAMRRSQNDMERRMQRLEAENTATARQNEMLWSEVLESRRRQERLQSKVQRLLYFMYEMYTGTISGGANGGNGNMENNDTARMPVEILDGSSRPGSAEPSPWAEAVAQSAGMPAASQQAASAVASAAATAVASTLATADAEATARRAVEAVAQRAAADVRADRVSAASGLQAASQQASAATAASLQASAPRPASVGWHGQQQSQPPPPVAATTTAPVTAFPLATTSTARNGRAMEELSNLLLSGDYAITPASPLFGAASASGLLGGAMPMSPHALPDSQLALVSQAAAAPHARYTHTAAPALSRFGATAHALGRPFHQQQQHQQHHHHQPPVSSVLAAPVSAAAQPSTFPVQRTTSNLSLDIDGPDMHEGVASTPGLDLGIGGDTTTHTPLLTPGGFDASEEVASLQSAQRSLGRHQATTLQHLNMLGEELNMHDNDDDDFDVFDVPGSTPLDHSGAFPASSIAPATAQAMPSLSVPSATHTPLA